MSVVMLLVYLALIGLVAWFVTSIIPMPPQIAKIIVAVCVVIAVLLVLSAFGLLPGGAAVPQLG